MSFAPVRHVVIRKYPHLGFVLVDGSGKPLYAFVPAQNGAACTSACAATWPTFHLSKGMALDSNPTLPESRIILHHTSDGGSDVSYSGWLLHSYAGDSSPGVAHGQGVNSDGGHWYLISPSGALVKKKP